MAFDYKEIFLAAGLPCSDVSWVTDSTQNIVNSTQNIVSPRPVITFERALSAAELVIFSRYMPGASWDEIRVERLNRLKACDWTQLVDAPISEAERAAWGVYRQALRDLPQVFDEVGLVVFPVFGG
jgi:hypothetical protein